MFFTIFEDQETIRIESEVRNSFAETNLTSTSTSTATATATEFEKKIQKNLNGNNRSCSIEIFDENIRMYLDEKLLNENSTIEHNQSISICCSDIGQFKLIGPKTRICYNGVWSDEEPRCEGLSKQYNYSCKYFVSFLFVKIVF